jgi:hypothetical protein
VWCPPPGSRTRKELTPPVSATDKHNGGSGAFLAPELPKLLSSIAQPQDLLIEAGGFTLLRELLEHDTHGLHSALAVA